VFLNNGGYFLGRWREYFEDYLNTATLTPTDSHDVHLGKEKTIAVTEVSLAVETLKAGKAAGCDEIQPEMIKA